MIKMIKGLLVLTIATVLFIMVAIVGSVLWNIIPDPQSQWQLDPHREARGEVKVLLPENSGAVTVFIISEECGSLSEEITRSRLFSLPEDCNSQVLVKGPAPAKIEAEWPRDRAIRIGWLGVAFLVWLLIVIKVNAVVSAILPAAEESTES